MGDAKPKYEKPIVVDLQESDLQEAAALCTSGASDQGTCWTGSTAGTTCFQGNAALLGCLSGGTAGRRLCWIGSTVTV